MRKRERFTHSEMNSICDVVVLTWNQLDVVKKCIESFFEKTNIPSRLIIIDNNSCDGTKEYIASLKDTENHQVSIVLNSENRGFVRGMNQGIALSEAPYVCLANSDLIFTKDWLKEIILVFEKYPDVGVLNPDSNNLGLRFDKGESLDEAAERLKIRESGDFEEMPFCIGFCMLIRRSVIEKVGVLSEEFIPMFFEDTDYSMKSNQAGYRVGVAKRSYVWHEEHVSLKDIGDKRKEEIFKNSRDVFFKKWGKILRIAWIVENYKELVENINRGIELARNGNFVWFFVKNLKVNKDKIFKENGFIKHSGVYFISYRNRVDLMWKILKKKKRYQPIIVKSRFLGYLFANLGYEVIKKFDRSKITEIKKIG
ncbi:MAG: glycosyltransferase family 2 protein [Candidatus Kaelpia imicola]|nr:glycosyltransferase family 2 protein [Candidatus Kaelpia imicola]